MQIVDHWWLLMLFGMLAGIVGSILGRNQGRKDGYASGYAHGFLEGRDWEAQESKDPASPFYKKEKP